MALCGYEKQAVSFKALICLASNADMCETLVDTFEWRPLKASRLFLSS